MEINIITPPVASTDIELDLVNLTEYLVKNRLAEYVFGLLGGEFGYGTDFKNNIFEMRPFYWGDCTCGWDEMVFKEPHSELCYQSLVEKELIEKHGFKMSEFGLIDNDKLNYNQKNKIEDTVRKKYCKQFNLSFPGGCAVHCTCEHESNFKKWYEKNKKGGKGHAPDCKMELPNFKHYKSGLEIRWYKWIGRDMEYNFISKNNQWHEIYNECIKSILKSK